MLFHAKNFSSSICQLTSAKAELRMKDHGRIVLDGRLHVESGVMFSVSGNGVLTLGKGYINKNTIIACHKNITIGNGTTIGPSVAIYDHDHDLISGGG